MANVFQFVRKGIFAGVALGALCAFADASVYYVKTGGDDESDGLSWATAKASVAGAVAAVVENGAAGCEIRVAGGVYVHTASITLPTAGVTIRGGYDPATDERDPAANKTVLSGDKNGDDQWKLIDLSAVDPDELWMSNYTSSDYGAIIADGQLVLPEPSELGAHKILMPDDTKIGDNVVKGFVVSGGPTALDGLYLIGFYASGTSTYGSAINTESAAVDTALTVTNCVFAGSCTSRGAINFAKLTGARVVDSRFMYNRTARIIQVNTSDNRFENCDFIGIWKTGDAGGCVFHFQGGTGTVISNCLFELNCYACAKGNYNPSVIVGWQGQTSALFANNTVRENYAQKDVPIIHWGAGVMRNCLFADNHSEYTAATAPSVMAACPRADGCTFVSNSVRVAHATAGATVVTAPIVVESSDSASSRSQFVNCTFVDNRSYTDDCAADCTIVKAGAAIVKSGSTTADACVALANCTVWQQAENIPTLVSMGTASTGLKPSKVINSILKYAGEGQGCVPVQSLDGLPVSVLKSSVFGFGTDFGDGVTAADLLTDDLALEQLTVVDAEATVPVMRVGARVEGNDDTYPVGEFFYKDVGYPVYAVGDGTYEYLLDGGAPVKSSTVVTPDSMKMTIPDALGAARPAENAQRGAVESLTPAALTGKTLIVRAKPVGVCTFEGPTTQAIQPGEGSVAVTATAVASGSSFQSWQLEDGTLVSPANPLVLDSLDDDAVVYAVYSAAKVTYTFNLGEAGKFEQNGENTIAVEFSIGDVPVVPKYTIDETRFYERGWTLPALVGSADAAFALDYVAKIHRIVRYDSAAADGGDGESWATAMNDFGAAIDKAALWTGEVWVKKGIHKPAATASKFFAIASNVAIKGGFAGVEGETDADRDIERNRSILSGDLKDDDVWTTSAGATVRVIDPETCDFTPVNPGHADEWWWVESASFGSNVASLFDFSTVECDGTAVLDGLWLTGCQNFVKGGADAHPTLRNCTFIGAGRIYLKSAMTIDGCKFIASSANGGSTSTGCIYNDATISAPGLVVTNTLFDGIRALQRGGITGNGGALLVSFDDCTFSHCYINPTRDYDNNHGTCIGGTLGTVTARRCRFVGNKAKGNGHIFVASTIRDSVFEANVIDAAADHFATTYQPLLSCGTAVRCSFVSNKVTRTGLATGVCQAALVSTSGSLIGCTFDGNEVAVSLDEGSTGSALAGLVFVIGNVSLGVAQCTFVGNEAPWEIYRMGGNKNSGKYPLTVVSSVFADGETPRFSMSSGMNRSVFGMHFVGSVIPGFDATADGVVSAQNVVSDEMPTFVRKPLVGEYAWGRKLLGCQAGRKAAVPVFQTADGIWCFTDADGTNRKLSDRTVVEPEEPISKYSDPFGEVARKCVPGAVQSYQGLGLVLCLF